jgi:hypothetical protein
MATPLHALEAPPLPDTDDDPTRTAEQIVLGALLTPHRGHAAILHEVTTRLTGPDFASPRHELIYDAITYLYARNQPVDAITVADRLTTDLRKAGGTAYLHHLISLCPLPESAPWHADIVAEAATRRRLHQAATRITQATQTPGADLTTVIAEAQEALNHATTHTIPGVEPTVPGTPLDVFLAEDTDDEPHWLIPGFLERRDRIIVTAAEGTGKSTLLRQWATQAALGQHPFSAATHTPVRVLLVDLENSDRQIRRALRPLALAAGNINPSNLIIVTKPDGLDLTTPTDQAWLDRIITHHKPDILITGPIYKLAGGNPNDEIDAKPAALALDTLRARHDIAVVLEAHTRKSDTSNPKHRPKEPFGWSGWMRWPEFGIHLSKDGEITHWRGMRDDSREFPEMLIRGGKWPWTPAESPDEIRFHQIRKCVQDAGERLSNREISRRLGIPESTVRYTLDPRGQQWQAILTRLDIESQDSTP